MPDLACYLNLLTLAALPEHSTGPRLDDPRAVLEAIAAGGYAGVQGFEVEVAGVPAADPELCASLGLGCATSGRVDEPGSIDRSARRWRDRGYECATVHVGRGHEDDATVRALLEEIVAAAETHQLPLFVETHRGTVTQDTWRTVQMTRWVPELRFNGDFSHWYTGLEMTYGDFDERLAFLQPVFDRTRFLHGRIGDPGCIQIDVGDGDAATHPSVAHFQAMWSAVFGAADGERIIFAPELLPAAIHYARTVPGPDGHPIEDTDRWQQSLVLCDIARACHAATRN
jgi:hypothetical protein